MTAPAERPPGLLHNIGGPPRASILWRGFGRPAISDEGERIEAARQRGTWLHLTISIGQRDARYQRDWNSAGALLRLMEPDRSLGEVAAARRVVDLIEEYAKGLDWPRCLLVGGHSSGGDQAITLDHVPTAFVALAKSAGNLWLRDRPAHLAPLQAPTLVELGNSGVRWGSRLWFPDGVPGDLLAQVLLEHRAHKSRNGRYPR